MNINLPGDLQSRLQAAVQNGRFPSVEDAMAAAAWLLLEGLEHPASDLASRSNAPHLGLIGALRDDADLLDQAVEYAMRVREERPWRLTPVE